MKRILLTILALGLVAVMSVPAMAEVQNIKVSGGMDVYGVIRDNMGGADGDVDGSGAGRDMSNVDTIVFPDNAGGATSHYMTSAYLAVDADLTDNVAATIKMGNERDWASAASNQTIGIWSGYVTLREFLYSPMTLKAGRMPVRLADGLLIGNGATAADATIAADDLSNQNEFDTIHAIFDYDPLTLVVGTLKITEALNDSGDIDGYLFDAIYKFEDDMNTVLDAYLVSAHYGYASGGPLATSTRSTDLYALAACLTMDPVEALSTKVGLGYEFGDASKTAAATRDLKAYAFDLAGTYSIDNEYAPKVGLKYVFRSGDKTVNDATPSGDYKGWLPLFEDQMNGMILDPNRNVSAISINGSIVPMDRLTVLAEYWMFNKAAKPNTAAAGQTQKKELGTELDLIAKYAYTEDLTLGLGLAWFWPGDAFAAGNDETATQLWMSMGLKF